MTLASRLSGVEGLEVRPGAALDRHSTLRIGGPAELLVLAHSEDALRSVLAATHELGTPLQILGLGSNVLIPDAGLPGVVLRLTGELADYRTEDDRVDAGAAIPLAQLARRTVEAGLIGLEALSGFPSTLGGAVVMNAGCYGVEIKDVLIHTTVFGRDGVSRRLTVSDLAAGYRTTCLQGSDSIVVRAMLQLQRGETGLALEKMEELNRRRRASWPSGRPNAGSVFRNPSGDYAGRLIEVSGLKGARCGGAQVSHHHANVIVNTGQATATDVLELMLRIRRRVEADHGFALEPEVVLLGELAERWRRG